jgi:hypothetical protein
MVRKEILVFFKSPSELTSCITFVYKNSGRTLLETHYVSATKPNRLMLCEEIAAVHCEDQTKHLNTLLGQSFRVVKLCHLAL